MDVLAGMQGALGIIPPQVRDRGVSVYKPGKEQLDDTVTDGEEKKEFIDVGRVAPVALRSMQILNRKNSFENRLVELLSASGHLEPEAINAALLRRLKSFRGQAEPSDDITLLGLKFFQAPLMYQI